MSTFLFDRRNPGIELGVIDIFDLGVGRREGRRWSDVGVDLRGRSGEKQSAYISPLKTRRRRRSQCRVLTFCFSETGVTDAMAG